MEITEERNDTINYENLPTTLLRAMAFNNKIKGGIFINYNECEIKMLTKRQIVFMLKTERKYKQLRRDYESNK